MSRLGGAFDRSVAYLLLLLFLFVLVALAYHRVTPYFEGPDSGAHFRYISYLHPTFRRPPLNPDSAAISHELVQQPPLYYAFVALLSRPLDVEGAGMLEVENPYYRLGMSHRATVTPPLDVPRRVTLPLRIAIGVSLLGGVLTMAGTWWLIHGIAPERPFLAHAAAAIVGFNPQFVFTSVTITNDTWAAATVVWTIATAADVARHGHGGRGWFLVGLLQGAAMLAKYSGMLALIPVVALLLWSGRKRNWRSLLSGGVLVGMGILLVAGLWYGENLLHWRTVVPLQQIRALLPGLARETPLTPAQLWTQLRTMLLVHSYWGTFGYGVLPAPSFFRVTDLLLLTAGVGLLLFPIRLAACRDRALAGGVLLALLWLGAMVASLLNWIRTMNFSDQGRLLFPAAPALALLLLVGWLSFLPRRAQPWLARLVPLLFIGLALWQYPTVARAYERPQPLAEPSGFDRPVGAVWAPGMELLGIDLPAGATVEPGGVLPVTLYFRAREEIAGFYTLFLHLNDETSTGHASFDGVPLQGRHPTRQWLPGQIFADQHYLTVEPEEGGGLALLTAGFYDYRTLERVPVVDAAGQPVDTRVVLAEVRLDAHPLPSGDAEQPVVEWEQGIVLYDFEVEMEGDRPRALSVEWGSRTIVHSDYTVFVQALNAAGELVAQVDQRPGEDTYPTDTWVAGTRVRDRYTFEQAPEAWSQLIIGLYDEEGDRLPLLGQESGDYYVLAREAE